MMARSSFLCVVFGICVLATLASAAGAAGAAHQELERDLTLAQVLHGEQAGLAQLEAAEKEEALRPILPVQHADGRQTLGARIIGGYSLPISSVPWQVALLSKRWGGDITERQFCGASLVHPQWVLTAGHCVTDQNGAVDHQITALMGLTHLLQDTGVEVRVAEVHRHEGYVDATLTNDIALIKLAHPVETSDLISPVALLSSNTQPGHSDNLVGMSSTVAGWGLTRDNGRPSETLLGLNVPVISNTQCRSYRSYGIVSENQVCTYQLGQDSCQGDSGGPVVITGDSGRKLQIGVVSWGIGCARPDSPAVLTRVSAYQHWIEGKAPEIYSQAPSSNSAGADEAASESHHGKKHRHHTRSIPTESSFAVRPQLHPRAAATATTRPAATSIAARLAATTRAEFGEASNPQEQIVDPQESTSTQEAEIAVVA